MEDAFGKEMVPGLYRTTFEGERWIDFNKLELYVVQEKEGKLVARDINNNFFSIEDPGFYDRTRNPVNLGSLDSFDLILIDAKNYKKLTNQLIKTQKRISKLLQRLENNKANLSAESFGNTSRKIRTDEMNYDE
jgi:hypothetical protein